MITIGTTHVSSPLGSIVLYAHGDALIGLEFGDEAGRVNALRERFERHLGSVEVREACDPSGAARRLSAYFAGDRQALVDQRVEMLGTDFERAVWGELRRIPVGRTISYGQLAARVGRPNGSRAAGQANGRNPIGIVVPCHRVIAADGTLGGYGGGLDRKRWLLEHEGALEPALLS